MANKNVEVSPSQPQVQAQQQHKGHNKQEHDHSRNTDSRDSHGGNTVLKSGSLSIPSKVTLGWTQWKKRWFILTRTSLVFFRSDPNVVQQKGCEVNITIGGIDLNNSGSVVVKEDKKLLTVLFPDGRDGRAFTLKADTMADLYEWKSALENALIQAPITSQVTSHNSIFTNDHHADANKAEEPTRSTVIGTPVLFALDNVDGSPSFLEKSLRFVEDHGSKIEGILRQAADVDDVEHRIREYDQGKTEFSPTEDAHVIADCLKYFLRELPSSPVPASCCKALLQACRTDRGNRVNAMREAIFETFPEPNRRILQRILKMMKVVASNKNVNRMNTNAVAACMAPLLLRPLLHGECEIENDFDVGGDGSMQLLQAAAAANHAQAIMITLLEQYDNIFCDENMSPTISFYSSSEESDSEAEEGTDDEEYDEDDDDEDDYTYDEEEDLENESDGSYSESVASTEKHDDDFDLDYDYILTSEKSKRSRELHASKKLLSGSKRSSPPQDNDARKDNTKAKAVVEVSTSKDKNSSTSDVHTSLEQRKKALYVRRQALEKDVGRLEEELKQEKDKKAALEIGLNMSKGSQSIPNMIDEKLKKDLQDVAQAEADIANLEHKVTDLECKIGKKEVKASGSSHDTSKESRRIHEHNVKMKEKQMDSEVVAIRITKRSSLKMGKQQSSQSRNSKLAVMSKRPSTKGEGSATATASALSKLSTRLNFLKERRSQIANQLSSMDKGRSTGQSDPSFPRDQIIQETEKGKGSNQESESSELQNTRVGN